MRGGSLGKGAGGERGELLLRAGPVLFLHELADLPETGVKIFWVQLREGSIKGAGVGVGAREVEVAAEGKLLVLENIDQPGMVGTVGTILGKAKVNIADMSLSRLAPGGTAYMVVRVDQEPGEAARAEIKGHAAIKLAKFVQL